MDFNKSTLVLIVSFSCLLLHTNAIPQGTLQLARVYNLCRNVTHPSLCVSSILAYMRGPYTPYKAVEAQILATKDQALKASKIIDAALANPSISKSMNASLSVCKDQYDSIMDSINAGIKEVSQRNVGEARFTLSAVISFYATCRDVFERERSPIAEEEIVVSNLGANCLDLVVEIQDRETRRVKRRFGNKLPPPPPPPPYQQDFYNYPPGDPCYGVIGSCHFNSEY